MPADRLWTMVIGRIFSSVTPPHSNGSAGLPLIGAQPMKSRAKDALAALTCVVAGVLISALPHFIAWNMTGRPDYVASLLDERYYLAIGGQAYFNHPWFLTDPCQTVESRVAHRPLPLLPGILAAKLLALGPLGVGLMWRILAGAAVGLGWSSAVPPEGVASDCRGLPVAHLAGRHRADPGHAVNPPLQASRHDRLVTQRLPLLRGSLDPSWVAKSITPATTMVYLIALIWAVLRAREAPSRSRIAVAGLTFGLLFHVYFYYWTAAGLALILALALDAGYRRVYFHVGWIGGLIGLPAILADFIWTHGRPNDWLLRIDKFVSIGRFDELVLPRELPLFMILGLFVLARRRDLIFVWVLGLAGLLLENHQIVTRLSLDNFHWEYVWGPALCFLTLLAAAALYRSANGLVARVLRGDQRSRRVGLQPGAVDPRGSSNAHERFTDQ